MCNALTISRSWQLRARQSLHIFDNVLLFSLQVAPIIIPPKMPLPFIYRIVNAEGFNYGQCTSRVTLHNCDARACPGSTAPMTTRCHALITLMIPAA
jgi:hypothetical protein